MLFSKRERRKRHPVLAISVAALAVLGLSGLFSASKNMITEKCEKIKHFFCKMKKKDGCTCGDEKN
ncbi:MAG: hypothetical protein IJZ24_01100 [Clostridia bacterium]|nr:hypothetical protein [Clostridia bacterium]